MIQVTLVLLDLELGCEYHRSLPCDTSKADAKEIMQLDFKLPINGAAVYQQDDQLWIVTQVSTNFPQYYIPPTYSLIKIQTYKNPSKTESFYIKTNHNDWELRQKTFTMLENSQKLQSTCSIL